MQNKTRISRVAQVLALGAAAAGFLALTGCSAAFSTSSASAPIAATGAAFQGRVHGGQQPVSGSTIQLYAANTSGYGATSYALLTQTVTTDAGGNFNITGSYTCPSASSLVYLTATGGNPGTTSNNANIAMMAPLGACGNLSSSTFILVNELTTVASAYALAPFMSSVSQVSTSTTNLTGLTNAFATVNKLVNIATGAMPGSTLPADATEPTTKLNSLADILAYCVNSTGGTSGDGTACGNLFALATPTGGTAPTDTIGAALLIAKNPSHNTSSLLALVGSTPPFQPTQTAATDFTVSIKYKPTTAPFSTPSAAAVNAAGDLWVANSGNNTLTVLDGPTGVPTSYTGAGLSTPSGIAFDASGNAWVTDSGSSRLSVFTAAGVGTSLTASGLSGPSAISIDGQGALWVTNKTSNTVSKVSVSGTTITGSTVYSGGGVNTPVAVAINPR